MNNDEQNNLEEQNQIPENKKTFRDKAASGLSKANNLYQDYRNAGSLTGMAKNAINNKINEKVNNVKDKAKEKIHDKKDQLKNNAKDKINSKLPDSVKQKKEALKNKSDAIKNKINAPKNKINEMKGKVDDFKRNINQKAFKTGVKTAVNAVAPGAGEVASKMLETPKGKPALEAAGNASNPVSAIKEGTKKLIKIVISGEIKKKLIMTLLPVGVCIFMVVIVVIGITSKFTDSQNYSKGDITGSGLGGIEQVDEKYEAFYKNVEKYSDQYNTGRAMIIATLTAYKDNDIYSDMEAESESVDEETNSTEIPDSDSVTGLSKSKMKKYIKKVAKAINNSGNDVTEGDYKDRNTGSKYFWWLYDDFVDDYYEEYLDKNSSEYSGKKEEIIRFIYLYYEDIKDADNNINRCINSYSSAYCPEVTVTGKDAGTYDLEEYITAVVAQELGWSGYSEAKKAQAIAARTYLLKTTNNCEKSIENSTSYQTANFEKAKTDTETKKAVEETAGMVLVDSEGEIFLSQYSTFSPNQKCNGNTCTGTFITQPNNTKKDITIDKTALNIGEVSLSGGHKYGMSQYGAMYMDSQGYSYQEILKYFYEGSKISATSTADGENVDHGGNGEKVRLTVYGAKDSDKHVGAGFDYGDPEITSDSKGWLYYTDTDGSKYLIVATATEECLKSNSCASSEGRHDSIKYYNYFDKLVLSIKGVEYPAIVLDSCGACMKTKESRGDTTDLRFDIWITESAESNNTHGISDYDGILYDDGRSVSGSVCGYTGSGLVTVDGYEQRTSRPPLANTYYYKAGCTSGNCGAYGLEGECAWYAEARAKEILAKLNNGASWDGGGNGGDFCYSASAKNFQTSTDYKAAKPGALVSWGGGSYGHVAVVESVIGDNITISEAGLGFGPKTSYYCSNGECIRKKLNSGTLTRHTYCEADGSGCFNIRTVTKEQIANLSGQFKCYIYLSDPK